MAEQQHLWTSGIKIPSLIRICSYYFFQGNIRAGQGNIGDALRLHSIGLKVRKQVLGDHIQTAASCYRTGDLMDRTGKPDEAM